MLWGQALKGRACVMGAGPEGGRQALRVRACVMGRAGPVRGGLRGDHQHQWGVQSAGGRGRGVCGGPRGGREVISMECKGTRAAMCAFVHACLFACLYMTFCVHAYRHVPVQCVSVCAPLTWPGLNPSSALICCMLRFGCPLP